jgi:hypothetical protein
MNKIFIDNIIVMLLYVIIQKKIKIFMDKTIVIDFYFKNNCVRSAYKKIQQLWAYNGPSFFTKFKPQAIAP